MFNWPDQRQGIELEAVGLNHLSFWILGFRVEPHVNRPKAPRTGTTWKDTVVPWMRRQGSTVEALELCIQSQ